MFEPAGFYRFPVREPQGLWAEAAGVDGVNLRWGMPHQPAVGYEVSVDRELLGFTPTMVFALRGLDADKTHTAEVRTVWHDGTLSEKAALVKFTLKELLPQELTLSDLNPLRVSHGWRQPELRRTFTGKGLVVKGKHYADGVGMPTNSEIEFEVGAAYDNFSGAVGLDDEYTNAEGTVEFVAVGDGRELWKSGPVKKEDGAKPFRIDVKGVRQLALRVSRIGEGGRIHADWVDAKLTR